MMSKKKYKNIMVVVPVLLGFAGISVSAAQAMGRSGDVSWSEDGGQHLRQAPHSLEHERNSQGCHGKKDSLSAAREKFKNIFIKKFSKEIESKGSIPIIVAENVLRDIEQKTNPLVLNFELNRNMVEILKEASLDSFINFKNTAHEKKDSLSAAREKFKNIFIEKFSKEIERKGYSPSIVAKNVLRDIEQKTNPSVLNFELNRNMVEILKGASLDSFKKLSGNKEQRLHSKY